MHTKTLFETPDCNYSILTQIIFLKMNSWKDNINDLLVTIEHTESYIFIGYSTLVSALNRVGTEIN